MNDEWCYDGEYRRLANTASDRKGSIHDDSAARSLGFRKAFVPGSVVGHFLMPAILERYGTEWLDGGWYELTFVSPVYVDEDVHTVARDSAGELTCRVETAAGRLCAHGRAGLGTATPWETEGALADVFPHAEIGTAFSKEVVIRVADAEPLLRASHDASAVWTGSVPPEHLMPIALRMIDFHSIPTGEVRQPGMWAQHALVSRAPIRWDQHYEFHETLVEKGTSGRTAYLSFEFRVIDADGNEAAVGRHKCKFLEA